MKRNNYATVSVVDDDIGMQTKSWGILGIHSLMDTEAGRE